MGATLSLRDKLNFSSNLGLSIGELTIELVVLECDSSILVFLRLLAENGLVHCKIDNLF